MPMIVIKQLAFFVILSGFLTKIFSRLHNSLFLKGGCYVHNLVVLLVPFPLPELLNWGGAKTGNSRVDQNRDQDQGKNSD